MGSSEHASFAAASLWDEIARLVMSGEYDLAEQKLNEARKIDPDPVGEALVRARITWSRGNREAAIALLNAAFRRQPSAAIQKMLAEMYAMMGHKDLALEAATAAALNERWRENVTTGEVELWAEHGSEPSPAAALSQKWQDDTAIVRRNLPPHRRPPEPEEPPVPEPRRIVQGSSLLAKDHGLNASPPPEHEDERSRIHQIATSYEDMQMDLLLGGDAFRSTRRGPTTQITDASAFRLRQWTRRFALLSLLIALVGGGTFVLRIGLAERARSRCQTLSQDLRQLLRIGSYASAVQVLSELETQAHAAHADDTYGDLIALANALLYRFHDREPERTARARRIMNGRTGALTTEGTIARALLILDPKPKEAAELLRKAVDSDRDDVNAVLLLGIAASKNGERAVAERAFRRAEELEPPHLASLFEQLEHWARVKNEAQATELLSRMSDVNPNAPWTKLGGALAGQSTEGDLVNLSVAEDAPEAVRTRALELLAQRRNFQ
jgi:tetratricopeptide (TPR) repeat protein